MEAEVPKLEENVLEQNLVVDATVEEPATLEVKTDAQAEPPADLPKGEPLEKETQATAAATNEDLSVKTQNDHPPELYLFIFAVLVSIWLVFYALRMSV